MIALQTRAAGGERREGLRLLDRFVRCFLHAPLTAQRSPLFLALIVIGCLGPPYQTPPIAAPQQWQEKPGGVGEFGSPAERWWRGFGDPILDEFVGDAVSSNLDLRVAASRVREARALRGLASSHGRPQVDGVVIAAESRDDGLFDAGFDAVWELDLFGGIRRDIEAAAAEVQATDEARLDFEITLIAEVVRNYVELRGAQKRLDVLDARVNTLRQTLEIVRARSDAGLTNDLDVARSEALLHDTLAARPSLEYLEAAAAHRLAVLMARHPGALRQELAPHAPVPAVPAEITVGLPRDLIARRPDVRRAERELAAATARIDVARADLFPRIALFGAAGRRGNDDANVDYWSFGPALRWPLLTGGRVFAQIEARRAQRDQAEAIYQQRVLRALEEVENSLSVYGRNQSERAQLAEAVAAEARAVALAESRYRAGLDNFLTVLDAQRTLRDGEDRLASAETRAALAAVSLYKALGGRR